MKELVQHIEALLLEHDCVIIPQVGSFVTCNVPARYIEEESLFLPPYRTVGFNEHLKTDDGLLVGSFAKTYNVSDAEAKKLLGVQVREMQQDLWESGTFDLGSIGVLTMDERNNIQFSPCQAGTVCPDYYGLDSLLFPALEEPEAEDEVTPVAVEPRIADKEKEITIRLKKTWLHNIAAVAAAVVMFFLLSPDAANTSVSSNEQASFANLMVLQSMVKAEVAQPKPMELAEEAPVSEVKKVTEDVAQPVVDAPEPVKTESEKAKTIMEPTGFCVVVASAITEANANAYVEKLHKNGHKEAQVYKNGKMVRVVFPGYKTNAEAHAKMNELSDLSEEFAHAWVYEIK